jgi:TRC40/GET3/ArsA family transport-energizing ATPase
MHARLRMLLMALPSFTPTRVLFFTGKGGVGKTSLACATAVTLADGGLRVLLVSTDPASNLDEVLGVRLSNRATDVPGVTGLSALNIDPAAAAQEYRDRVMGPYRNVLPAATVARIEEQLSGACTVEIAAFDQFTMLLGDHQVTVGYDHVIFDTAPTGHTLRLLKLPAAWTGFIDTNTTGTSCLGPLSGLQGQVAQYRASLAALADPAVTTIVLVSRPDPPALAEAARTSAELADLGVVHQHLVINGVFCARDGRDPIANALEARGREALAALPQRLTSLPRTEVPLSDGRPWRRRSAVGLRSHTQGARGPPSGAHESSHASGINFRASGRHRRPRSRRDPHDGQRWRGQDDDRRRNLRWNWRNAVMTLLSTTDPRHTSRRRLAARSRACESRASIRLQKSPHTRQKSRRPQRFRRTRA